MSEKPITGNTAERLTLLLMVAAIFFSLFFGLESLISSDSDAFSASLHDQRKLFTDRLAAATDPQASLARSVLPLLRLYSEDNGADLDLVRKKALAGRKLDLTFFKFDQHGNLKSVAPAKAGNTWLMRNLFAALRETNIKKVSQMRKGLDKKIEFSFGYGKDLNSIRENPETIIETVFNGKPGFLAWTSRENGGLIITCPEIPHSKTIFKAISRTIITPPDLIRTGILDQNHLSQQNLVTTAKKHLNTRSLDSGSFAGYFWVFANTKSARTVFAVFSEKNMPGMRYYFTGRLILAITAAALLIFFATNQAAASLSLKKLVIYLFFASSFIPLSSIAFTSLENVEVFRQIHTNKLKAGKEEALRNIIQNFGHYTSSRSEKLMQLTMDPGENAQDPKTIKMVQEITREFPEARITIRNAGAEILFNNGEDLSSGRETTFKSIARRLVERYAPERAEEMRYIGNIFSDKLVRMDDMGFGTLLNYPNRIQLVSTGNAEFLLFFRILPATAGKAAFVMIELSTFHTIKRYLQSIRSTPIMLEGINIQVATFFPRGFRWSLAPPRKLEKDFLEISESAHVTAKSQFRRATKPNNGFFISIPAPELSGNCLTAFCSADLLDETTAAMKRRMAVASVIALILVLSMAYWLSTQLISPLDQLEQGIRELAARNFSASISVPASKDEFAQLFIAFNEMMAESYDMQVAHSVQEGLVPSSFPKISGYSMFGMLRPVSELGGDCLDCFLMPDGKLLFLVGDITGHGVGSALIMAFARAVTFHWSQGENLSPVCLTEQIDQMLRQNRTERMFMGIICAVLDLQTHELELVVKGHIYPLLLKKDKSCIWTGRPAYPLGIGKKQTPESVKLKLDEGDSLLCMTDGFLETYNRNMKSVGFDGIENWAIATRTPDAAAWVNALENRFRIWCNDVQSDDISMFILCRNKKEAAE